MTFDCELPVIESSYLFHEPYLNNNVWVYANKEYDKGEYNSQLTNSYVTLNKADLNFKNYISELNTGIFNLKKIDALINQWDVYIDKRANLVGAFFAKEIIQEFDVHQVNLVDYILKDNESIITDFINISTRVKSVLRINLCITHRNIHTYFNKLIREVFANEDAFSAIERVELAARQSPAKEDYPTIILYLKNHTNHNTIILLKSLHKFFAKNVEDTEITNIYADRWNAFVNVTQGFKLYKVYLDLFQLLSIVYSQKSNYAYLNYHDAYFGKERMCDSIQTLITEF